MDIFNVLTMLGGLALFLFGMNVMGQGLERAAGNQLKNILEKLTSNPVKGFFLGIIVTAVIQSSSATTVMVVGFVSSGVMTLYQAVGIIMGANVGTTVTAWILSLNGIEGASLILKLLKPTSFSPVLAVIGAVLFIFCNSGRKKDVGSILLGFATLMYGMDTMSSAVAGLKDVPEFANILLMFSNPILGVLAGAVLTAIIQSSSAAVGIVQTLSESGILPFGSAVFVLFGTNIGTCVTAVLSSMGANRNAKRATLIHLMFNMIGTIIFTAAVLVLPITNVIENLVSDPMARIAAMHTTFNIVTTLLLLPLGNYLAKLATVILPIQPEPGPDENTMHLAYLKPITAVGKGGGLGNSAIVIDQLRHELQRMTSMARENIADGFDAVLARDMSRLEKVEEREEYIDFLNKEISGYVSHLIALETNEEGSAVVSSFFTISGNLERIGDHADNLAGYTRMLVKKNTTFSETARKEIGRMKTACLEAMDDLLKPGAGEAEFLSAVAQMEQKIDDMTAEFRRSQLKRMRDGTCDQEACIIYSELLTDFERIGDHALNIAEELTKAHVALTD